MPPGRCKKQTSGRWWKIRSWSGCLGRCGGKTHHMFFTNKTGETVKEMEILIIWGLCLTIDAEGICSFSYISRLPYLGGGFSSIESPFERKTHWSIFFSSGSTFCIIYQSIIKMVRFFGHFVLATDELRLYFPERSRSAKGQVFLFENCRGGAAVTVHLESRWHLPSTRLDLPPLTELFLGFALRSSWGYSCSFLILPRSGVTTNTDQHNDVLSLRFLDKYWNNMRANFFAPQKNNKQDKLNRSKQIQTS